MEPTKRIAIFALYSRTGELTKDVEFLIASLKQEVFKLVIVVNGQLKDFEKAKHLSDFLIIRENAGYDAGAYKEALLHTEVREMMEGCQELVFCNDTFYGPFITFREIWNQMNETDVDFWGLNLSDNGLFTFLQSYFLVFKKKTWSSLIKYFDEEIDEYTFDFQKVLVSFEQNLFMFMKGCGFVYGAYRVQRYNAFSDADGSICYDGLPILKKKVFSEKYYDKKKIFNALSYIDRNYNYDIELILKDVEIRNSIRLLYDEIKRNEIDVHAKKIVVTNVKHEDIVLFAEKFRRIYIYGIGKYSKLVRNILDENMIAGFIVSDDQKHSFMHDGQYVYGLSEFKCKMDRKAPILAALGEKNKQMVQEGLCDFENVLYLF